MKTLPPETLAEFIKKIVKGSRSKKVVTKDNQVFTIVAVSPDGIKAEKRGEDVLEDLKTRWN